MKQNDKFLIVIVAFVLLLVIAAFVVVLRQPEAEYSIEDTASAAVFNYLLAIQEKDYEEALTFLSDDLPDPPEDADDFERDIQDNPWRFDVRGEPTISIGHAQIDGDKAIVIIRKTWSEMPIMGDINSSEFDMELQLEDEGWKLIDGESHWLDKWGWE